MPDALALQAPPSMAAVLRRLRAPLVLAFSRGLGVLAQVALQVAVGALGGPASLGLLQLFASWTSVIGEVVGGGYPTRVLRDTAVHAANGDRAAIRQGLWGALRRVAGYGIVAALAVAICLRTGLISTGATATAVVIAVLACAPLFAASRLCAEALKGLDRPLAAVALENLSLPVTLLGLCALLAALNAQLSATVLLAGAGAGTIATLFALAWMLHRALHAPIAGAGTAPPRVASGEQLHFWANGLLNIAFLQLPFLLLPLFADAAQIGYFAVAHKLVNIITTLLILMAALFGPRFARAAAAGDVAALRAQLLRTQVISSLIFLPGAAVLLLMQGHIAPLFSLAPGSLHTLLWVLCSGQLVNALTGLPGVLLTLTGGARREMQIQLLTTGLSALAMLVLGGRSGIEGAALAMSTGIAIKNIASFLAAHRHLNTLERSVT
jgi:O-antigen/teichoic acid export membrane protein